MLQGRKLHHVRKSNLIDKTFGYDKSVLRKYKLRGLKLQEK